MMTKTTTTTTTIWWKISDGGVTATLWSFCSPTTAPSATAPPPEREQEQQQETEMETEMESKAEKTLRPSSTPPCAPCQKAAQRSLPGIGAGRHSLPPHAPPKRTTPSSLLGSIPMSIPTGGVWNRVRVGEGNTQDPNSHP